MTKHPQKSDPGINRVLVSFDTTTQNKGLLESVAKLASCLDAELTGLYIEDINLLELATLPFAREVIYGTTRPRKLEREPLERSLRTQARQLNELMELIANKERIRYSFSVTRGERTNELISATSTGDLLILERKAKHALESGQTLLETQTLIRDVSCSVIVLNQSLVSTAPIVVLFENTEKSKQALNLAIDLARSEDRQLFILFPNDGPDDTETLKQQALILSKDYEVEETFISLKENSVKSLIDSLHTSHSGVFIFDATSDLWSEDQQQEIIDHADCSVIFFR